MCSYNVPWITKPREIIVCSLLSAKLLKVSETTIMRCTSLHTISFVLSCTGNGLIHQSTETTFDKVNRAILYFSALRPLVISRTPYSISGLNCPNAPKWLLQVTSELSGSLLNWAFLRTRFSAHFFSFYKQLTFLLSSLTTGLLTTSSPMMSRLLSTGPHLLNSFLLTISNLSHDLHPWMSSNSLSLVTKNIWWPMRSWNEKNSTRLTW